MAENTFLGLQPYTEDDAYRFKGRTEESQELFRLIVRNDFTVCYAESGEGKTSLLNAGVFPLLRENMYFPIAITFTSDDYQVTPENFSTIIDRCIKDSITEYNEKNKGVNVEYRLCSTDFQGLDCQTELQQELSQYSWWKLRNYKPQAMGLTFTPVFVFDQFEEVFNMPDSIVWTKKFFDWLEDVSSDSCPDEIAKKIRTIIGTNAAFPTIKEEKDFKAVFSLRKEFIGELDYWGMQKCFIPSLKDNRYCLKALTYEGAKKVMTQQELFDEEKVEQILTHFVRQYSREPEKTIKEQLPIIPALLLSVVCDSWEKDITAFSMLGTEEVAQSLNMILENFYSQAIDAVVFELSRQNISLSTDQCRHDIDTAVFSLIDGNGKRVRTKTTTLTLTQIDFDNKYKQALCDYRIIKVNKVDGEDYVEIVHDSLCPIIVKRKEERIIDLAERAKRMRIYKYGLIALAIAFTIIISFSVYNLILSNKKLNISQSRLLAGISIRLTDEGNTYLAQMIALQALPPNRPYTPEAEDALRYACSQKQARMIGHNGAVVSANFSPDGKHIVSASTDGTIKIWNSLNGQCLNTLKGYDRFDYAEYSPDGRLIVSPSGDGRVFIWDAETGRLLSTFFNERFEYREIVSARFSPDGKYIAYVPIYDKSIQICGLDTEKHYYKELKSLSHINFVAFSPDGKNVVAATTSDDVEIWDLENGERVRTLKAKTNRFNTANYSPDGKYIVTASVDSLVRIWDAESGECIKMLKGHKGSVYSASFSHDGHSVVSSSNDGTIRIWGVNSGLQIFESKSGRVYSASFSPNDNFVVYSSADGSVGILNLKGEENPYLSEHMGLSYSNISPQSKYLSSYSNIKSGSYGVLIMDMESRECIDTLMGHTKRISSAMFSNDGNYVVTASSDSTMRVWDIANSECCKLICGHAGGVRYASFSPSGKSIMSISSDSTLRIWNSISGECERTISDYATYAAFSSDGKYIATASDSCVNIWDTVTGECIHRMIQTDEVRSVSYSPNDKYIAAALENGTIKLLNADSGECITTFVGHKDMAFFASFSHDGKFIVSVSRDGAVRLWSVTTGICIKTLNGYGLSSSVIFSPDDRYIVMFSRVTSIMWPFTSFQNLINQTRERFKDRQLTPEERRLYYLE